MDQTTLKAYAKINLSLDVIGKRPEDGYHLLEMVMQEIALYDEVTLKKSSDHHITLSNSVSFLPTDHHNIAYKACALMKKTFDLPGGYHIHIQKNIPVAAGLAGGSTNAAAVMRGICQLEGLVVSDQDLMTLSLQIGSDIPFCLVGGTALAAGIGEVITPLLSHQNYWVVLVKPSMSVSTQGVYQALRWDQVINHPNTTQLIKAIEKGNVYEMANHMGNVLETVTEKDHPIITTIKQQLRTYGAIVSQMSGSGPSVFGLFRREDQAKSALKNLKRYYQHVFLVRPVTRRD